MMIWVFTANTLNLIFHMFGNSPDLRLIARFTNDKKISNGLVDLSQVKGYDMLSFFLLYRGNDGFDDFRVPR